MNKRHIIISVVLVVGGLLAYSALTGKSAKHAPVGTGAAATQVPATSSSPAQSGSASQMVLPTTTGNPIVNNSIAPGFVISGAIVENNTDPVTKKIATDHLEVTLQNTTTTDISQFEVYYTVKDVVANVSDAYYSKLTGFVLKAGETKAFHFDNSGQPNHYPENKYSVYRTSKNSMLFSVMVSAPNYKVQAITIKKDKGGAEKVE
jgi:hypothetical protein